MADNSCVVDLNGHISILIGKLNDEIPAERQNTKVSCLVRLMVFKRRITHREYMQRLKREITVALKAVEGLPEGLLVESSQCFK